MRMRATAVLVMILLARGFAQGQEPGAATLRALRIGTGDAVTVDGALDESVWDKADLASGFLQRDPDNGAPATEQTEVRVVFDANRLVIGVICRDTLPDRVLGNQMQRDSSFDADDRFLLTLDTFLDGRTGYYFEINPSGAMGDGLVDPSQDGGWDDLGAGINKAWDGIWLARVRRSSDGWSAEIEIPFRTLNFSATADAWGINFQRTVRRKNEDSLWTGHARNQGVARMLNAGRIVGLSGLSQGIGLDLKPYLVGSLSSAPGRGRPATVSSGDIGLDTFYNLTPALRVNVSVNTDFAETEVDQRRVNLTRFPLFFEERRDFFLEGSSFFDFARGGDEEVVPFFSRRIGLDDRGTPQRIDVGAKLTGQAGAYDVGILQVRTAEQDGTAGEDFSVFRTRRRLFEQSYVGAIYTRRSSRVADDRDRHTAGVDVGLRTSSFRGDQNLEFSGFYLSTNNPSGAGDSDGYGFTAAYPNDPFNIELAFRELQPNYDPAVGFVERRGYRLLNPGAGYTFRFGDHPWIRDVEVETDLSFINDANGRPLTRELEFTPIDVNFQDGSRAALDISRQYERLDEDFEISDGVVLPEGQSYDFTRIGIGGSTADHRIVAVGGELQFGRFFSGSRREMTAELSVRPRRGVMVNLEAERNVLELAEGGFDADVFRARANTQLSPWLSVANNLQYDTVSRLLGWQLRVRWIQRPGNDFYVVYTHNWHERALDGVSRLATLDNRLATKLVYTLRF